MNNELGGKIMIKFVTLRAKAYSYFIDDGSKDEKAKDEIRCAKKRKPKFDNYKDSLQATQLDNKINLK